MQGIGLRGSGGQGLATDDDLNNIPSQISILFMIFIPYTLFPIPYSLLFYSLYTLYPNPYTLFF